MAMAKAMTRFERKKADNSRITRETRHMRMKSMPKAAMRVPTPHTENASVSPSGVVTFRILF